MRKYNIVITLLVLLMMFSVGCAKNSYTPHPGSINTFDSVAYDAILDYKAGLDEAKAEYAKGQLTTGSKEYINKAVAAYNVANTAYQAYHAGTQNAQQLQDAINAFAQAVAAIGGK